MSCDAFRDAIYAEEPVEGLREHLAQCLDCARLRRRLIEIDRRAREEPIPAHSLDLLERILRATSGPPTD